MFYSQKDYLFSHTMSTGTRAHQPVTFKVDVGDLITPFDECSALFVVDSVTVTAYKQVTLERVPVKFTVLNENKKRVLTNDPCKLSSKWRVDLEGAVSTKIAGTDTEPFNRTLSVHDEENRQALVNVLDFMMSDSLRTADRARGALAILAASTRGEFEFVCERCFRNGVARVTRGLRGPSSFSFPRCYQGYVCLPTQQPRAGSDYEALRRLLALLDTASLDNLEIVKLITKEYTDRSFQEIECASYLDSDLYGENTDVEIPYQVMKYVTSLYQAMSDHADNFAIVDEKAPHVRVLIESPSENIGEIVGSMSLTIIYGSTLSEIHSRLRDALRYTEGCEMEGAQRDRLESLANITQLDKDVSIRRTSLSFKQKGAMSLKEWCTFYHG